MDAKIKAWLEQLYESNKIIFYVVVPLAGLILLAYQFRNILIDLLVKSSKDELKTSEKTDTTLATQAAQTQQEADKDVAAGNAETSKEPPVGDDWNTQ